MNYTYRAARHTHLKFGIHVRLHGWLAAIGCISILLGTGRTFAAVLQDATPALWIAEKKASEKNSAELEMEKLQGTWQLVYQLQNGLKIPDEKSAKMFHGKMVFDGDKIRYTVMLPGFDFKITYVLHPEQQPKAIDMHVKNTFMKNDIGEKAFGIYLLEDDTLKICHSGTKRPVDFNAAEGSRNVLIVLKRQAPEALRK